MTAVVPAAADPGLGRGRRFAVLGPLEVRDADGRPVELGSAKMRAVLTLLLVGAGRMVSLDRIIETLWGDSPPPSATGTVQSHISNLRRILEPGRVGSPTLIVTSPPGYRIAVDPAELDLLLMPSLVAEGARLLEAGDVQSAAAALDQAVGLWRGEPLSDLGDHPVAVGERVRLADLYLLARERRAAAWTSLGRPDEAVAELERLLTEHPLRERIWLRLVEALYASGRQAEALEACRTCTRTLRDELGIDPSADLRELQQAVLRQDLAVPVVRPQASSGAVPQRRAGDGDPGPVRPLVGRRSERSRLQHVMAEVAAGNGAIVVLEGEAGIGKTRLAEAATSMAAAQGWQAVWGRCADDAGAPALWPWTQAVLALGAGPLETPEGADPDLRRFSLFQDLRRRLEAASAQAPVLVVLDDVQAADATSLQLLGLLARHLGGLRVLVVLTVRTLGEELPEALVDCLAGLAREPRAQRVLLAGLSEGDVRELISAQVEGDEGEGLTAQVYARTEGNPFFVVELMELLRSEHRLEPSALPLPPSVRDVLEQRLARLPQETVALLRLAALAGRDVELSLMQGASELSAETVISQLEPAVASRVLVENPVDWQWRFSHSLVQETLVAGLGRLPAARLHAQLAQALEARADGRLVEIERVAYHYFHAVPVTGTGLARRYATAAATAARQRLAHVEAAAHTRRALSLLGAGDGAVRHDLLVALGDDLLRSGRLQEAQKVVAEALALARELDDHDRLAEAASVWGGVTLWNWRGYGVVDDDLVALLESLVSRAGEGDPGLRARLLGTLGVELAYSERRAEGIAYAMRAVELARELDDPALLGRTLNNYALVAWGSADRVIRRMAAADETLALSGRGLPARTEFFALLHRGPMRLHLGDVVGFEADLAAAGRIGASLTGPEVRPHLLYQETARAMLVGAWAEAEELAVQANDLFRDTSLWGASACWAIHQFTFRRREGRLDAVADLLREAADMGLPLLQSIAVLATAEAGDVAAARRLRQRWPVAKAQDWTADVLMVVDAWLVLAMGGDVEAAYAELAPYGGRQIVVGTATACWGPYDAVLGDLATARGDTTAAAGHYRRAAEVGERVGSGWQTSAARAALARLG